LGIDEGTAVKVVDNNLTIIGTIGVYLIDMTQAVYSNKSNTWTDVIVNYLTVGDTIIMNEDNTYSIEFANYKKDINNRE
jgi:cyanophycinase-like exopeptidase